MPRYRITRTMSETILVNEGGPDSALCAAIDMDNYSYGWTSRPTVYLVEEVDDGA